MKEISRQDKYRWKYKLRVKKRATVGTVALKIELWEACPVGILVFTGSLLVKLNIK